MAEVALGYPMAALVGVTISGPPIDPLPDIVVELEEGIGTDHMAMVIGPASQACPEPRRRDRVELVDKPLRGLPCACPEPGRRGRLTEGFDLRLDGLKAGLARSNLQLGRFATRPLVFAEGLPQEVESFRDMRDLRLFCRQRHPAFG